MNLIKSEIKKAFVVILAVLMLFSVPVITNADSEGSIEIKMDLSYKYKRDDFRVIYKDASGKEYDVTSKSDLAVEEIETGVTTGGGDGIVRKAVATYNGLEDTVYEYTFFFEGGIPFNTDADHKDDPSIFKNLKDVNSYLMEKSNKTVVVDIYNIKIKKDTYPREANEYGIVRYGWTPGHSIHVTKEINYIGCNSDNSDYDMPIFDGDNKNHNFLLIGTNTSLHPYKERTCNFYNFQVQNYQNGITTQFSDNSTIKGMVFRNIQESEFCDGTAEAALAVNVIDNAVIEDNEFSYLFGKASYFHALYLRANDDNAMIRNNFFLNTGINAVQLRDAITNARIEENYFYNSGSVNPDRDYGIAYVSIGNVRAEEEECLGNIFVRNYIRNEKDIDHVAVVVRPKNGQKTPNYSFESNVCSDCTNQCTLKDYYYKPEWGVDAPSLTPWLNVVNSRGEGNTSEISSEPFVPVRSIIRHIDDRGNTLRANDVIVTNGGETFTAQAKADLIGADGNPIYTSDYKAKLYDESGKEVTKDVEGKSIVDADGYIKTDGSGALLKSLKNDNQTFTFIYAPSARLTINHKDADGTLLKTETKNTSVGETYNLKKISDDFLKDNKNYELIDTIDDADKDVTDSEVVVTLHYKKKPSADTGDTIDYSSITDIKELEKHIPIDVSSDTPAPAAAVEALMLKTESDDDVKGSSYLPLKFQSRKQKKNAVTLKWSKVSGAEQYVIYGNLCNTKAKKYKMVKIATLKSSKKSHTVKKIEGKKLKKGTYYKFIIVAQKGDKVIAAAKTIHVATTGNKKKSNYTGVSVDKKTIAKAEKLKKGASLSLKAKPTLKKGTKAQNHIKGKLRYESSNRMIATVSKNGKIKAKKKGTCYVYAYTQSGITKKIKVEVV